MLAGEPAAALRAILGDDFRIAGKELAEMAGDQTAGRVIALSRSGRDDEADAVGAIELGGWLGVGGGRATRCKKSRGDKTTR